MRCTILHRSIGRMRIHIHQSSMTLDEADRLENYLRQREEIKQVRVDERTCNVILIYPEKQYEKISEILSQIRISELGEADLGNARAIRHRYEQVMFWHVAKYFTTKMFAPISVRNFVSLFHAIPILKEGLHSLFVRKKLDVHILDASSVSFAILQRDFATASEVMFLLKMGEIIEEWTQKKGIDDLANAMRLHVDRVWMLCDGKEVLQPINNIKIDDILVLRDSQLIPLDGIVVKGEAMVNQATITGEPLAIRKHSGAPVFAGTVVEEGELFVKVTQNIGEGQYDTILKMIEKSEKHKSQQEVQAVALADRLVPLTFLTTLLTFVLTKDVTRAYSIMMVDFCCALKLSMPIASLSAMREAHQHDIRVKSAKVMEHYAHADTIVFDKTGTLTKAQPKVADIVAFNRMDEKECLRIAACLEEHYPHSIANAVVKAAQDMHLHHEEKHSKVEYVVAHGIVSELDGQRICIGSRHFIFDDEHAEIQDFDKELFETLSDRYSQLFLSIGGILSAVIYIDDPVKEEAKSIIKKLHLRGFDKIAMLTGDNDKTARRVAQELGLDYYMAEVLPKDKADFVKLEKQNKRTVAMIGDGVNDSPALSEAEVGIAMNSGAAIAQEIADVIISADALTDLIRLRDLCSGLEKRMAQNYRMIMGFNGFLILLAMFGFVSPTTTALLHNSSTIGISMYSMTNILKEEKCETN